MLQYSTQRRVEPLGGRVGKYYFWQGEATMSKLVPYRGGKRLLTKTILSVIPEHEVYCEPFAGSATVLLAKMPSLCEVLNDVNGEMVNLFRIIQLHPEEFIRQVRWNLRSREEFARLKDSKPQNLTDIQRAARIYFLLRAGYAGKLPDVGCHFTGRTEGNARPFSIYRIEETLYEVHQRLESVTIEHLPYSDCIRRYDTPSTFFYLDPPYWNHETDYGAGIFTPEDFSSLKQILEGLQGKFLLSINDTPEIRELFVGFHLKEVSTIYTQGTRSGRPCKKVQEFLISNYRLSESTA
jgi:DNA adenine methylase